MHVKRQMKVGTCGKQNTMLQAHNSYTVENENFTLEKCSNLDKMMQVTNFVSRVNKGVNLEYTMDAAVHDSPNGHEPNTDTANVQ